MQKVNKWKQIKKSKFSFMLLIQCFNSIWPSLFRCIRDAPPPKYLWVG